MTLLTILDRILVRSGGGRVVVLSCASRIFSSISGLYPLDVSTVPSPAVITKNVSRHQKMSSDPYSVTKSRPPKLQNELQVYEDTYLANITILTMLTLQKTHEKYFNKYAS